MNVAPYIADEWPAEWLNVVWYNPLSILDFLDFIVSLLPCTARCES
jgi:hypothetical protein